MTKKIIYAVKEREAFVRENLEKLTNVEVVWDIDRNAMNTFLRALERVGLNAGVFMEDDIMLCDNFEEKLEKVIMEKGRTIIQFFSMRKKDIEIGSRYENGSTYLMNQCFYLPWGCAADILRFFPTWYEKNKEKNPTGLDTLIADYMKERQLKYWIQVPSLVDHREGKSIINPKRSSKRQSLTFQK